MILVINSATSGKDLPYINEKWLKPGAYVSLPAGINLDQDFVLNRARRVVDNWKMYEAYAQELRDEPGGFAANLSGICGYLMALASLSGAHRRLLSGLGQGWQYDSRPD